MGDHWIEIGLAAWALVERILTIRRNTKLKSKIEDSVTEIAAHIPTLQAQFDAAAKQAQLIAKGIGGGTTVYTGKAPKRKP